MLIGLVGLLLPSAVGSGHSVIEGIMIREYLWYIILTLLAVKIILIILCGGAGATGGLFIPILTIGALTGGLLAELMLLTGVPSEYYSVIVTVTIASFLGATLRAPITAIVFFIEAFSGFNNILFAALGVLISFVLMEILGVKPLYEVVLERKLKVMHKDEVPRIADMEAVVRKGAFVIGKTTRDIFWPPSCHVMTVVRAGKNFSTDARMDKDGDKVLKEGDTLLLRIETYDIEETKKLIADLVGKQDYDDNDRLRSRMP